jgi:hypothetical protein
MALAGRSGDHHALMGKLHLRHVGELAEPIDTVGTQIEAILVPFSRRAGDADDHPRLPKAASCGTVSLRISRSETTCLPELAETTAHGAAACCGQWKEWTGAVSASTEWRGVDRAIPSHSRLGGSLEGCASCRAAQTLHLSSRHRP